MESKYKLYLQGVQSFADPWACGVMCQLQILDSLPGELARMAHHIVRDPEQRTALIEQFYADADDHMRRHPFVLPEPLPPLPEGVTLPFALLTQRKEGSNE